MHFVQWGVIKVSQVTVIATKRSNDRPIPAATFNRNLFSQNVSNFLTAKTSRCLTPMWYERLERGGSPLTLETKSFWILKLKSELTKMLNYKGSYLGLANCSNCALCRLLNIKKIVIHCSSLRSNDYGFSMHCSRLWPTVIKWLRHFKRRRVRKQTLNCGCNKVFSWL